MCLLVSFYFFLSNSFIRFMAVTLVVVMVYPVAVMVMLCEPAVTVQAPIVAHFHSGNSRVSEKGGHLNFRHNSVPPPRGLLDARINQ